MRGPFSAGAEVGGRYRIDDYIGEGGMQYVYAAYDVVIERSVALKIPKSSSAAKRFKRSAVLAARINHPNVAKTLDYFDDNIGPVLVEELIEGGDLQGVIASRLEYLDPYMVARIIHHIAKGLAASHHVNIVHRDLKPTNIMIGGGMSLENIKITDFGIAKMAEEELAEFAKNDRETMTTSQTAIGALPYMAPEAIISPRDVSYPADVWSLGAMAFEMLTGTKPFDAGLKAVKRILGFEMEEYPEIITRNPQFRPLVNQLRDIIRSCLQADQEKRLLADNLVGECEALCYPVNKRLEGVVQSKRYSQGFIDASGEIVFFHLKSVFGRQPKVGDRVSFSKFPGAPRSRAHPVLVLRT